MGQHRGMGDLDDRLRWRRNRDLREWIAARGWSEVDGETPALAATVGRPHWKGTGVVLAAEGMWSGRRAALARHHYTAGEGSEDGTAVWVEVRRPAVDHVVTVQRRLFERLRRSAVTGAPPFDRLFRVWPRQAAPTLPRGLLIEVLRVVHDRRLVVLAPGAVQLSRRGWLRPPDLERLLDEAVALAAAADGGAAAPGPADAAGA